jgi:hypothetical protein
MFDSHNSNEEEKADTIEQFQVAGTFQSRNITVPF